MFSVCLSLPCVVAEVGQAVHAWFPSSVLYESTEQFTHFHSSFSKYVPAGQTTVNFSRFELLAFNMFKEEFC